jgi:hypothetical protein
MHTQRNLSRSAPQFLENLWGLHDLAMRERGRHDRATWRQNMTVVDQSHAKMTLKGLGLPLSDY